MSQLREDLQAAYDTLEARGWCQKEGGSEQGAVCLEGAAAVVTMGSADMWTIRFLRNSPMRGRPRSGELRFWAVIDELTEAIPDNEWGTVATTYPNYVMTSRLLYRWNDLDFRTVEDVKMLLKRAIEGCDGGD